MDRNPESPWNPRVPTEISPTDFEKVVLKWLRRTAQREQHTIETRHLGVAHGAGAAYKIDVLVTFSAFAGAFFVVLVECKHQVRPVEREDVMVLESKLRDVGAHKGMLFSTSGFQSGALEFAGAKGIATILVVEGNWLYETRAAGNRPVEPPPWAYFDSHAGFRMAKDPGSAVSCHTLDLKRLEALEEWLRAQPSWSERSQ